MPESGHARGAADSGRRGGPLSAYQDGVLNQQGPVVLFTRGRRTPRLTPSSDGLPAAAIGGGLVAQSVRSGLAFDVHSEASGHMLHTLPGAEEISGGGGLIVTVGNGQPLAIYEAGDGRLLRQRYYTSGGPGPLGQEVMGTAVYQGQVRILQTYSTNSSYCAFFRLISVSASGAVTGISR